MKKYVMVGCGNRGINAYAVPMVKEYRDCAKLCGVYDVNYKRSELVSKKTGESIPVYSDFDTMLDKIKPDTVIVTTPDACHDEYIIRAMRKGCDVISEKPLTTTFEKSLAIRKAEKETGKKTTVTFNLRFNPAFKRVKELIRDGVVGEVLSVHFQWMLDTRHGAEYFRRWHRERKNSGSLLVHKSTHHFDLINWYLDDEPEAVHAFGAQRFYGPVRKERSDRCLGCPHALGCEFYTDIIGRQDLKEFYYDCEDVDGYIRDACVFSDKIDIEDTVSVSVKYKKGAVMSYSLTAHSLIEGCNIIFNGTDGRLEFSKYQPRENGFNSLSDRAGIRIYSRNGEEIKIPLPEESRAGHGGADKLLLDCLFRENAHDGLNQMADTRDGMMSIGVGMAANISMKEKRTVELSEFYK